MAVRSRAGRAVAAGAGDRRTGLVLSARHPLGVVPARGVQRAGRLPRCVAAVGPAPGLRAAGARRSQLPARLSDDLAQPAAPARRELHAVRRPAPAGRGARRLPPRSLLRPLPRRGRARGERLDRLRTAALLREPVPPLRRPRLDALGAARPGADPGGADRATGGRAGRGRGRPGPGRVGRPVPDDRAAGSGSGRALARGQHPARSACRTCRRRSRPGRWDRVLDLGGAVAADSGDPEGRIAPGPGPLGQPVLVAPSRDAHGTGRAQAVPRPAPVARGPPAAVRVPRTVARIALPRGSDPRPGGPRDPLRGAAPRAPGRIRGRVPVVRPGPPCLPLSAADRAPALRDDALPRQIHGTRLPGDLPAGGRRPRRLAARLGRNRAAARRVVVRRRSGARPGVGGGGGLDRAGRGWRRPGRRGRGAERDDPPIAGFGREPGHGGAARTTGGPPLGAAAADGGADRCRGRRPPAGDHRRERPRPAGSRRPPAGLVRGPERLLGPGAPLRGTGAVPSGAVAGAGSTRVVAGVVVDPGRAGHDGPADRLALGDRRQL